MQGGRGRLSVYETKAIPINRRVAGACGGLQLAFERKRTAGGRLVRASQQAIPNFRVASAW